MAIGHLQLLVVDIAVDGFTCGWTRVDLDDLTLLTQPSTRLEERTSRRSGSGLGLAIVSSIVDAHKAELIMTARPRGGLITQVVFAAANSTAPPPSSTTR